MVRLFLKLLVVGVVFGAGLHVAKQFPKRDGIPEAMPAAQTPAETPRQAVSLHMSTKPESSPAYVPDLTPMDESSRATPPPVVRAPFESELDDISPPPDLPSDYVPGQAPSPDDLESNSPFELPEPAVDNSDTNDDLETDIEEEPLEESAMKVADQKLLQGDEENDPIDENPIADALDKAAEFAIAKRPFQEGRATVEDVDDENWRPASESVDDRDQDERQDYDQDILDDMKAEHGDQIARADSTPRGRTAVDELAKSFTTSRAGDSADVLQEESTSERPARVAQAESPSSVAFVHEKPMTPMPPQAPRVQVHTVVDGDSLPTLATKYLGRPDRYMEIYAANRDQLSHPAILPIGMNLIIPLQPPTPRRW